MRVLITGANGFIGSALCRKLLQDGFEVIASQRKSGSPRIADVKCYSSGNIDANTNWMPALSGVEVIIHLAGRAHVMREKNAKPLAAYRIINTEGTINLANQAVSSGVRRLIFISSVKVCGEGQLHSNDDAYNEIHSVSPLDPYAISKLEAERGLHLIAESTGLEVVILRPPLVYGPGVGVNFLRLMDIVKQGWPLPFGAVDNHRSLIYLGNLVDAISVCVYHPDAAHKTFLLSDGDDLSTPDLIRCIAQAFDMPARLVPVSEHFLRFIGMVLGKRQMVNRLVGSLVVDSGAIRRDLNWFPPFTIQQGLVETAKWYESKKL